MAALQCHVAPSILAVVSAGRHSTAEAEPGTVTRTGWGVRFAATYVLCLAVVTIAVAFVWETFNRPQPGIDDAYIFFVYARNLAEGHGFVYNVGGEAVEGFTSLLWTLICAVVIRTTANPLELLLAINVALVALRL